MNSDETFDVADLRPPQFAKADHWAMDMLNGMQLALLVWLIRHSWTPQGSQHPNTTRPSHALLAFELDVSERKVRDLLNELKEQGVIDWTKRYYVTEDGRPHQGRNEYAILPFDAEAYAKWAKKSEGSPAGFMSAFEINAAAEEAKERRRLSAGQTMTATGAIMDRTTPDTCSVSAGQPMTADTAAMPPMAAPGADESLRSSSSSYEEELTSATTSEAFQLSLVPQPPVVAKPSRAERFDAWWSHVPKKHDRGKCEQKWAKLDMDKLDVALSNYLASLDAHEQRTGLRPFAMQPLRFLNGAWTNWANGLHFNPDWPTRPQPKTTAEKVEQMDDLVAVMNQAIEQTGSVPSLVDAYMRAPQAPATTPPPRPGVIDVKEISA